MKVEWSVQARAELIDILAHITQESPSGAARIHAQILHSISFLTDWPEIGRPGRRGYRELVIPHTPYVVLFRRTPEVVIVVRVLHASRRR